MPQHPCTDACRLKEMETQSENLIAEIEILRAALRELEDACDARVGARTDEQYKTELRLGQSDILSRLDAARSSARKLLRLTPNAADKGRA